MNSSFQALSPKATLATRRAAPVAALFSTIAAAVALVSVGCSGAAGSTPDTLDTLDTLDDVGTATAAATPADGTYYAFSRRDFRRCASPWCGGMFVRAVNAERSTGNRAGKTRCADGSWMSDCYVSRIEYASFGGDEDGQATFDGRFQGGKALIRGAMAIRTLEAGGRPFEVLEAVEAWGAGSDALPVGPVASLTLPDAVCLGLRCTRGVRDLVNNASGPSNVTQIVFAPGFTQADRDVAMAQGLKAGRGLLVAGTVTTAGRQKTLNVTQFYTRAENASGGAACGSRGTPACATGTYCAFPATSQCGANDRGGVCVRRPEVCSFQFEPVCGCDGTTYGNACAAARAGASVLREGACVPPKAGAGETCGGNLIGGNVECEDGLFCNYTAAEICGFADASGTCAKRPDVCTREYVPVCGCNGTTYSNRCSANAAGTAVGALGPCN